MNFTVPRTELTSALARCAAIAKSKALPVLSCVKLEPLAGVLRLTATDLEVGFITNVPGIIWDSSHPAGFAPFLLPARLLLSCVQAVPIDEVQFQVTDNIATISGGTFSATVTGLDADEYPETTIIAASQLAVDPAALAAVIENVSYCQSKDETKHHLQAVFPQVEENHDGDLFALAVATDGHRLCVDTRPLQWADEDGEHPDNGDIPAELAKGIVIPARGVTELLKLAGSDPAVLGISDSTLQIHQGGQVIQIRLLDYDYPDYNRVIPQNPEHTVIVKRQALASAVERCKVATNKESRSVRLAFDGDTLTLSSSRSDIGAKASDRLTIESSGQPENISLNCDYLLQALDNLSGAQVELHITNGLSPIIINPVGTDFPQAIVMPMRGVDHE